MIDKQAFQSLYLRQLTGLSLHITHLHSHQYTDHIIESDS